jgi:LysM repeat protein
MTYNIRTDIFWKIVIMILISATTPVFSSPLDSLRTERVGGKLFIIHQVDQGETLYSISRRYKVSVPAIIAHNQSAKLDLKIGIIISIPVASPITQIDTIGMTAHEVMSKETLFSLSRLYSVSIEEITSWNNLVSNKLNIGQVLYIKIPINVELIMQQLDTVNKITHVLQQGETLYSLSKKYEIEIDQLKIWNNLRSNTLSIGQLLIVGKKNVLVSQKIDTTLITDTNPTIDSLIEVRKELIPDSDSVQTSIRIENNHGFDETIESGIGELIPGSTESRKYLGLHRTAKVGTIMKVRNEMNDKMVFVRIIGRIPNTGDNNKVLLKISKAAYDRLGIIDPRFRIEISYTP